MSGEDVLSLSMADLPDSVVARIPMANAGSGTYPWLEDSSGQAWSRLLWADADAGSWASLFFWKAGYVAPPHTHLGSAHTMVMSGSIAVREGTYRPGDYLLEPEGAVHGATRTLEDCLYFFLCTGPIRFADDPVKGQPGRTITSADIIAGAGKVERMPA